MLTPLLTSLLLTAPVLNPIEGATVTEHHRDVLAASRHVGHMLDLWFLNVVSMQQNGSGIAAFDPQRFSAHGRSWTLNHHKFNGLDLTDPARSGLPLFEVPYFAWNKLRMTSMWDATPGVELTLRPNGGRYARVKGGYSQVVGGGLWLPDLFLNREPATLFGAPQERRRIRPSGELLVMGGWENESWAGQVIYERLDHTHRYLTLRNDQDRPVNDNAVRDTLMVLGTIDTKYKPISFQLGWQGRARSHEGAQDRLPLPLTREVSAGAVFASASSWFEFSERARLDWSLGFSARSDVERLRDTDSPIVFDTENQWLWMSRPQFGEKLKRYRVDLNTQYRYQGETGVHRVKTRITQSQSSSQARIPQGIVGETYLRGIDTVGHQGAFMTIYDAPGTAREWWRVFRTDWEYDTQRFGLNWKAVAAVDIQGVGSETGDGVSFISPAAGLAGEYPIGDNTLFALVRYEPQTLTSEVSSFLDPARPSGTRFSWRDDGDGVPEANEAVDLLSNTGGRFHGAAVDLRRPKQLQFAFGGRTMKVGPLRGMFTGVGRFLFDQFTVRYAQDEEDLGYSPSVTFDPGGDGRGETRLPGGGQSLRTYDRARGTEGTERYVLTNSKRMPFYLGTELQVFTAEDEPWFLRVGASGYFLVGQAPFGTFPDRADPGIVDEVTADPNKRLRQYGRFDQDRAFAINISSGAEFFDNFWGTVAARYRDGQPFTRFLVADLPQGPTSVMAVRRGQPRHTFHMTFDTRVQYTFELGPWAATWQFDVYNIFGSQTEILEDPRTNLFRRALETIPGRTIYTSLQLSWDDVASVARPQATQSSSTSSY